MKILQFSAVWCPGCIIMKDRWKRIQAENTWLNIEYFDADDDQELTDSFKIQRFPAQICVDRNAQEITRLEGEFEREKLIKLINDYKDK